MVATVSVRPSLSAVQVQTSITVAVDTSYVVAQQGQNISTGVYMMDNRVHNGSSGEGQLELTTVTPNGSVIGWNSVPLNPNTGDTVIITGFTVSSGNVLGSSGYPMQVAPIGTEPPGSYWLGQAMNQGHQTYQIQIQVTTGGIRPVSYFVNWDPFITSQ